MKTKLLFATLSAAWALTGCAWGPDRPDAGTGKPLPASPTSPRELSLKRYTVNLFGQYRVSHAYLDGINISACYGGAEQDDVRFTMIEYLNSPPEPGFVLNRKDIVARRGRPGELSAKHQLLGSKKRNAYHGYDYMQFDKFCGDWTAGGAVTLGIRDRRSQSIQQYIEQEEAWSRRYNTDQIAKGTAFRSERMPTEQITRNGNKWFHLHEKSPTAPGMDEGETWLLPVGDSNYYFYLSFGYVSGARAANGAEYLRTRALVDQIIDSFKLEKL
ncbi:DUF769 domain-containing protein [Ralstonia solanacearum]|uniref:DUF769 domain-containing protein n=2 Tax=Ralstonia solanacearum TaxID=305 RepID=UPI0009B87BE3|nr:DUF769 domain-containing protein [Ralstonia solanacearum]